MAIQHSLPDKLVLVLCTAGRQDSDMLSQIELRRPYKDWVLCPLATNCCAENRMIVHTMLERGKVRVN